MPPLKNSGLRATSQVNLPRLQTIILRPKKICPLLAAMPCSYRWNQLALFGAHIPTTTWIPMCSSMPCAMRYRRRHEDVGANDGDDRGSRSIRAVHRLRLRVNIPKSPLQAPLRIPYAPPIPLPVVTCSPKHIPRKMLVLRNERSEQNAWKQA